jgi:signal peptidase I
MCLALVALAAGCGSDREGHVYRIQSSAMEPTLHCARPAIGCQADEEDRVFAVPYDDSELLRGDIVVFETPPRALERCGAGGTYIKRVIGLPLEHWRERDGRILINGEELSEPWVRPDRRDDLTLTGGLIPPRRYLLLGDNRAQSCDSRVFGLVPLGNIRGQVVEIKRGSKRIHLR